MALISLKDITLAFGGPPLFDHLNLQLEMGERVALLGRNGTGKTTLMKVMNGDLTVDEGEVACQKGVHRAHVPQTVPADITGLVYDVVLSGLGARAQLLVDYHHVTHRLHTEHTPELMHQLGELQEELDRSDAWDLETQVMEVISRLKLDPESDFITLSGGQKRRALLARALVLKPEILMLDEPTNHLDIDAIDWLELFLKSYQGTVFFVTHDRMLTTHLATRIMELDRGAIFSWSCDYPTFLQRKQAALEVEAATWDAFDKKLAKEEVWIRRGVKARRTRNEGRVRALEALRLQKQAQRRVVGQVRLRQQDAGLAGQQIIKLDDLVFAYGDKRIVEGFTTRIMRGDKIGVIGPNGSGKTTLLRLLLGELAPQQGTVQPGVNLEIAYFDQLREQLDDEKTVAQNVCDSDVVMVNGRGRHIIGYLQDFLFPPDRVRCPAKALSGGERNRLLLARLFTKPFNVLVLDEPTNDLDVETLELLEEMLLDFSGTLLLVSHDRAFLNNVVTSTIVMEGNGSVREFPGGYDDWLRQRRVVAEKPPPPKAKPVSSAPQPTAAVRKMTFKEKIELAAWPEKIAVLENEQKQIYAFMSDVTFYQKNPADIAKTRARMVTLDADLRTAYERWEYLESLHVAGQ